MSGRYLDMARTAWGEALPAWIDQLARECDATSQAGVGRRMDYSGAAIGEVLRNKWTGSYANVEQAFKGVFQAATVQCPVVGEIPSQRCLEYQRQPLCQTNSLRIRLYRACRGTCPHSRNKAKETTA